MMAPIRSFLKWDHLLLRRLCRFFPGSHVKLQITGTSHLHIGRHTAILHSQFACLDPKHAGAGIHLNLVHSIS